jgi:hypothetical protein
VPYHWTIPARPLSYQIAPGLSTDSMFPLELSNGRAVDRSFSFPLNYGAIELPIHSMPKTLRRAGTPDGRENHKEKKEASSR